MNDYLEHHGIKGQKWGVRRFQNPDGTLTKEGKKRYSGKTTVLKKGTKFYRISTNKEEKDDRDYKYVSTLQSDRNYYKGIYAQDVMFDPKKYTKESYANAKLKDVVDSYKKDGYNIYEITYEASKDLISPNKKERIKMFSQLIKQDPELIKRVHDDLIANKFFGKNPSMRDNIDSVMQINADRKVSDVIKDKEAFRWFSASLNDSEDIRKKYFDILSEHGYNIIVDDNDAGEITYKPMIVINPADVIKRVEAKELMAKDIAEAYNSQRARFKKQGFDIGKIERDEY